MVIHDGRDEADVEEGPFTVYILGNDMVDGKPLGCGTALSGCLRLSG